MRKLRDYRKNVAGRENQILLAGVLHLCTAVLAVDNAIADGNVERNAVSVVIDAAGADGNNFALLRAFLSGVRNNKAGRRGLLSFEGTQNDAILERLYGDRHSGPTQIGRASCRER